MPALRSNLLRLTLSFFSATYLALLGAPLASPAKQPTHDESSYVLWYSKPAAKWEEALPLGNGRMGAMVFGGTENERIQFNEDTLWTGKPRDYARESAGANLAELRRLILAGNDAEAKKLGKAEFLGEPSRQKAYQPFGDVRINFPGHATNSFYRRELDLRTGTASTSYLIGDTRFTRTAFVSRPAQALVLRFHADKPGALTFSAKLTSPHPSATAVRADETTIALRGEVEAGGLRFESRLRGFARGGEVVADAEGIHVTGADEVTLVLVAATSFVNFQDISGDPAARCIEDLKKLSAVDAALLAIAHEKDIGALLSLCRFHLPGGSAALAEKPTDERLRALRTTGLAADPSLASLYFNFGRYLLAASSRPGSQPANLQGVWNELLDPPWESKWTTNINVEMNYWPAEVANLSECHTPLFDLVDDLVVSGRRTARKHWNAGGWVVHHNTDLWRGTAPINNIDGIWPTGGAWLCYHLWEHYLFTGDRAFLAKRAYPVMKESAQFFLETLVEHPAHGWLVTLPGYSPEQGSLTAGPAMDTQLIRALFAATVESAAILGIDAEFAAKVSAAAKRLPPDLIGKNGQLQEWLDDVDQSKNKHRHMSPLWAMYPGDDINPDRPEVFAAAKSLLRSRGEGSTGWSNAWRMPLWARAGDGDYAFGQFASLLQRKTLPNLFDLCGPFQIDGNFGATAGIAEMLIQSHRRVAPLAGARAAKPGEFTPLIELLPALPAAWADGAITGLRARGGFTVDLAWSAGKLTRVTLRSQLGRPCRLRVGDRTLDLKTTAGGTYAFDGELTVVR